MRRSVVQGFYQKQSTADNVKKKLEKQGFGRWAEIVDGEKGPEVSRHFEYVGILRYLAASLSFVAFLYFFASDLNLSEILEPVLIGVSLFLAVLGIVLLLIFPPIMRKAQVKIFQGLLTKGEILLLVDAEPGEVKEVLEIMREVVSGHPVSYLLRPPLPWSMMDSSPLLPGEPMTLEQQKQQAIKLAENCTKVIVKKNFGESLLKRLKEASGRLQFLRDDIAESEAVEQATTSSAEWLLDNMYLIKASIEEVQKNLTTKYYATLPKIVEGPFKGVPRIFRIAQELVYINAGKISKESIEEFLDGFQSVVPLTIGELWALPLMIKLSLIEGIKNLAIHIDREMREGELANFVGNRLLHAVHREPAKLDNFFNRLKADIPYPSPHFAEELMDHLFDEEGVLGPAKEWLEVCFQKPLSEVFHEDQRKEAADQVAFSNSIVSLITLSQLSWPDIFESESVVDTYLNKDPSGIYPQMDFKTRNLYRTRVESYARETNTDESFVSKQLLELSSQATTPYERHIGFYLIDKGQKALEKAIKYTPSIKERLIRAIRKHPGLFYISGVVLLTGLLEWGFYHLLTASILSSGFIIFLMMTALLPLSELACNFLNRFLTRFIPPNSLPHMSFENGIPEEFKTLVVVPTLLMSSESIAEDLAHLEIRFLANNEPGLSYALFSDYRDAPTKDTEQDKELLEAAIKGIEALQTKYGRPFYLFHRQRLWSPGENKWIGWERKRGKIETLNRYLSGDILEENPLVWGDAASLKGTKFVITLDADTQLPKNKGRELVEIMAHILNRPVLDKGNKRLERGYTLIQPKVSSDFSQTKSTLFTLIFSEPYILDPYSCAVSNVYQDIAGEGTYHGKGIYDVEAFHTILSERFPENHLLSHDLLEGAYSGVAYTGEVSLWDSFPEDTKTWAAREHRWIRGDLQIVDWLFPHVPSGNNSSEKNPLNAINRWKIFDNLRRAFVKPSLLLLIIAGLLATPVYSAPLFWGIFGIVILLLALPVFLAIFKDLRHYTLFGNRENTQEIEILSARAFVNFVWIPFEASLPLDALARVFYRRNNKKKLLQWTPSSRKKGLSLPTLLTFPGIAVFIALILALVAYINPANLWFTGILSVIFASGPFLAFYLGKPRDMRPDKDLNDEERKLLSLVARKTWRYFDEFMSLENNSLPPDNYQLGLKTEVAHRTSPTNIGLGLIAILSAYDFRYLTCDEALYRMGQTLETLRKLEKFQGHFLNWYDTTTLHPLYPRYISTVDSGNLIACFWDLISGLDDMAKNPVLPLDALKGCRELLIFIEREKPLTAPFDKIRDILKPEALNLNELIEQIELISGVFRNSLPVEGSDLFFYWLGKFKVEIFAWREVVNRYLSWRKLLTNPSEENQDAYDLLVNFSPSLLDLKNGTLKGLLETALKAPSPELVEDLSKSQWLAGEALAGLHAMQEEFDEISNGINLKYLYNEDRKLLTIGYNVDDRRMDTSYYDLLASEARTSSLVGIAKGDLPVDHWWALGRTWTKSEGRKVLVSWGGTMFEYLMPLIFTRQSPDSLIGAACQAAVDTQIEYGNKRGIPWGISEAAFAGIDSHKTYQYRSFGIPALGLKRGLEDDLVVSPYSSGLALMVEPKKAIENLKVLIKREGGDYLPPWGFYESIDYTRQKDRSGERGVIIYAFMAHHQGMMLASINNLLNDNILQKRFHADFKIAGVEGLLNERVPSVSFVKLSGLTHKDLSKKLVPFSEQPVLGVVDTPFSTIPKVNLLSNGAYSLMVTNAGGAYSFWNGNDVSRWRSDPTSDSWGHFFYIKDLKSQEIWSSTYQPTLKSYQDYSVSFKPDKVEYHRKDHKIETRTEIAISAEDNAEVTLLTFVNHDDKTRYLEITSYMELALAPHAADRAHQTFSKLFIETEKYDGAPVLLATRRPRSEDDPRIWASHMVTGGDASSKYEYETDRNKFIGRGRTLKNPESLDKPLSGSTGYVLDPIFSLRRTLEIKSGERVQLTYVTAVGDKKETVINIAEKYKDNFAVPRVFELAWNFSQVQMRHLRIDQEESQLFQKFAGRIFYPHAQLRASQDRIKRNRLGQSSLWAQGISGDLPIVTVTIGDNRDLDFVRQVLVAHTFWNMRGLKVDLVIFNEEAPGYDQPLFNEIQRLVFAHSERTPPETPGGVFLRSCHQLSSEDINLILSLARVTLIATRGPLRQQLVTPLPPPYYTNWLMKSKSVTEVPSRPLPFFELPYFNGLGGYSVDGKEYMIYLGPNDQTPAPWVNVIANPNFGTMVTESGLSTTWYKNSQSNRLTPWSNDPVINPIKDCLYIRDEELGVIFTPTPGPVRELDAYRIRHGQGYSIFEHNSHGIEQELTIYVPMDDEEGLPIRIQILKLHNTSEEKRILTVTAYAEWVLGGDKEEASTEVISTWDTKSQALFARRYYHPEYGNAIAFTATNPPSLSYTADRTEFLGRNRSSSDPEGMRRHSLSGRNGAALDPCSAERVSVELNPGETKEVSFVMGMVEDEELARQLITRFRLEGETKNLLNETKNWWDKALGTIKTDSPDLAMDFAVNRWLLYQSISCRSWGRTAFYQSSGAYGFRDQLQDCMAEMVALPQRARKYILYAATRQFEEGDVQHWWHPKSGGGVRTRMTDDRLWLVYVAAHYVRVTGDASILDEQVTFLKGTPLTPEQHEIYNVPETSTETGSLLEHCARAIKISQTAGSHGLPLMGGGDWNDGMNRVGMEGKGESVWLAWFFAHTLEDFAYLQEVKGLPGESYRAESRRLAQLIDEGAWDGEWYRRAYFDDGSPLGAKGNPEAYIDSLAQSWAAITALGDPDRADTALKSAETHLVDTEHNIVLLLTPPFNTSHPDPGYIMSYPPGVRENGGQYTHGSLWMSLAFARRGEGTKAHYLLRMMHPISHTENIDKCTYYKLEPYALAADIYDLEGQVGRGGWSWYTGSAGWMYRILQDEILGFKKQGDTLVIDPSIPNAWNEYTMTYRHKEAIYHIKVLNPHHKSKGTIRLKINGEEVEGQKIKLLGKGEFFVEATLA